MSTQQTTEDKSSEPKVEKTVTIIAYADPGDFPVENPEDEGKLSSLRREFAQALDPDTDYAEKYDHEETDYHLTIRNDVGDEVEVSLGYSQRNDIEALMDDGVVEFGDGVDFVKETTTKTDYRHRPNGVTSTLSENFAKTVDDIDGLNRWLGDVWKDDDGEWIINIRGGKIQPRRVLAHHTTRGPENRYESDDEVLSVEWTVVLGPDTDARIQEFSELVTGPFADHVARLPSVQKVRIADCKKKTEREGDCFDL